MTSILPPRRPRDSKAGVIRVDIVDPEVTGRSIARAVSAHPSSPITAVSQWDARPRNWWLIGFIVAAVIVTVVVFT